MNKISNKVKRPVAPPVYRPQPLPKVLQRKLPAGLTSSLQRGSATGPPEAPAVYRPQPIPKVLQTKSSSIKSLKAGQAQRHPIAPPVYRPEAKKIVQPKAISPHRKSPVASLVYRPEQTRTAQPKSAPAASACREIKMEANQGDYRLGSLRLPVQRKLKFQGIIQRAMSAMDDETLISLSDLHAVGKAKEDKEQLTADEIRQMKDGTYLLTGFNGAVKCNCFGWAIGDDLDTGDKGHIYNWKQDHGGEANFTDPDSANAKIILWGDKEGKGEDEWDVLHASVKLSHAELLARSGRFKGLDITKQELKESGIPDPCWSSAGGMGYGIFVHPRDWFEGGDFGVALKGMKAGR